MAHPPGESTPEEIAATERIAALGEALSDALLSPDPLSAVIDRLTMITRATVMLLDRGGNATHASGPLPLGALKGRLPQPGPGISVQFAVEGWSVAASATGSEGSDGAPIWVLAASRRDGFPTAIERAAIRFTATIAYTVERAAAAEQRQRGAIRSGVLDEALTWRAATDDPELVSRLAGLGIDLSAGARIALLAPRPRRRGERPNLTAIRDDVVGALSAALVPEVTTIRGEHVVVLAQATSMAIAHAFTTGGMSDRTDVGIGRQATVVAQIATSHADAALALRLQREHSSRSGASSFDDFDVATRLFAEVGLESMVDWAAGYLAPIVERPPLLAAISAHFATGQNVKAAAAQLGIHHNSMRYRLAKVEEALTIDLTDPGSIASLHLALTALELSGGSATTPLRRGAGSAVHDSASPDTATAFAPEPAIFGATVDPPA